MKKRIKNLINRHPDTKLSDLLQGTKIQYTPETLLGEAEEAWNVCKEYSSCKGTVYFVESCGFVKIGYTEKESADARLRAFQTGSPFEYRVLAIINGERQLEKTLHSIFNEQRYKGEWFYLTGALRQFIEVLRGHPIRKIISTGAASHIESDFEFERLSALHIIERVAA